MDANEGLDKQALGELISVAEMYDLMSTHHGLHSPNTYIDGSNTKEFIFGTKGILEATKRLGML
eukprot:3854380-Ditylum_brightwellii.AAC.1